MLAAVTTFALEGVDARAVTVEVDVRRGLPAFTVVGLPDASVREARERVRAALLNSGLQFPQQRITANLAPASLRKAGPGFDLALATGVLAASGQVPPLDGSAALCGELSLGGELRAVRGVLAAALGARAAGCERLIVPVANGGEAALIDGVRVVAVATLTELVAVLCGRLDPPAPVPDAGVEPAVGGPDMGDVRGQADAKRAIEIAAAGGHNLLMVGPPGAGKTMLARRMPGVLPLPGLAEALEITQVHSAAGEGDGRLTRRRPFRAPHHTVSPQGLVGGGAPPRPGEVTLAHRGVLFLDELPEFSRAAVEALRQPLEDGAVAIIRAQRAVRFPAQTMLVAACNPCPCGLGQDRCTCSETERGRYRRRLSGPLMDRVDLVCTVAPPVAAELVADRAGERSAAIRARVDAARERQATRLTGHGARSNGEMDGPLTRQLCAVGKPGRATLVRGIETRALTGRGHDRVLRVARTIADLDGRDAIGPDDVDEAIAYRLSLDPVDLAA